MVNLKGCPQVEEVAEEAVERETQRERECGREREVKRSGCVWLPGIVYEHCKFCRWAQKPQKMLSANVAVPRFIICSVIDNGGRSAHTSLVPPRPPCRTHANVRQLTHILKCCILSGHSQT